MTFGQLTDMTSLRQPLAARVWGTCYRTWWPPDGRHKKKAKRRSARRERWQAQQEIQEQHDR
jgi:hypothetical protein